MSLPDSAPPAAGRAGCLRLGTRGSALALAQARLVAELLDEEAELVPITTSGDRGSGGDKARFVKEIEAALAKGPRRGPKPEGEEAEVTDKAA